MSIAEIDPEMEDDTKFRELISEVVERRFKRGRISLDDESSIVRAMDACYYEATDESLEMGELCRRETLQDHIKALLKEIIAQANDGEAF